MTTRAIVLLASCVMLAHAGLPAVRASWNQIPKVLAGKYVVVQLENGTVIEGSWTDVTNSAFIFNIEKASRKDKRLKGLQIVSRSAVRKIHFRERRVRGRVIGTIATFYGILAIAAAAT